MAGSGNRSVCHSSGQSGKMVPHQTKIARTKDHVNRRERRAAKALGITPTKDATTSDSPPQQS